MTFEPSAFKPISIAKPRRSVALRPADRIKHTARLRAALAGSASEDTMRQLLKSATYAGFVIPLLAALLSPQAVAGEKQVGEDEGIVTQIGAHASAVTYWVAGPEGWDVVTTVDPLAGKED